MDADIRLNLCWHSEQVIDVLHFSCLQLATDVNNLLGVMMCFVGCGRLTDQEDRYLHHNSTTVGKKFPNDSYNTVICQSTSVDRINMLAIHYRK